ncbi:MAG: WecB/TagA/CpsF family glycosyltransferase [Tissierellia bacterium]|nr:WecB/TagA/CpsF family glycosyltransferase [Tissierellia bacterium]
MRINVLGIRFHDITKEEMKEILRRHLEDGPLLRIVTPNPEIVMAAQNQQLRAIINGAGLVLKDGVGIKWAEKLKGIQGKPRITGIETLHSILDLLHEERKTLYVVGSKEEVLTEAIDAMKKQYPHMEIVGHHHGYFELESPTAKQILEDIKKIRPHAVVVAMGFPKQEIFMDHLDDESASIALGCGGSLDVLSGRTKRAPKWMQSWGLEWLYRLFQEPSRWKRQLQIPRFLFKIVGKKNSCFLEEE